jgi:hypothetical protein
LKLREASGSTLGRLGMEVDKEFGPDTGTELGAPFRSSLTTELGEALVSAPGTTPVIH